MTLDDFVWQLGGVEASAVDAAETCSEDWGGKPPPTILMATIARALVDAHADGAVIDWPGVLSIAEGALTTGDQFVKDVVATGFLEALISRTIRRESGEEIVRSHFGEQARAYVEGWEDFVFGRSPGQEPSAS